MGAEYGLRTPRQAGSRGAPPEKEGVAVAAAAGKVGRRSAQAPPASGPGPPPPPQPAAAAAAAAPEPRLGLAQAPATCVRESMPPAAERDSALQAEAAAAAAAAAAAPPDAAATAPKPARPRLSAVERLELMRQRRAQAAAAAGATTAAAAAQGRGHRGGLPSGRAAHHGNSGTSGAKRALGCGPLPITSPPSWLQADGAPLGAAAVKRGSSPAVDVDVRPEDREAGAAAVTAGAAAAAQQEPTSAPPQRNLELRPDAAAATAVAAAAQAPFGPPASSSQPSELPPVAQLLLPESLLPEGGDDGDAGGGAAVECAQAAASSVDAVAVPIAAADVAVPDAAASRHPQLPPARQPPPPPPPQQQLQINAPTAEVLSALALLQSLPSPPTPPTAPGAAVVAARVVAAAAAESKELVAPTASAGAIPMATASVADATDEMEHCNTISYNCAVRCICCGRLCHVSCLTAYLGGMDRGRHQLGLDELASVQDRQQQLLLPGTPAPWLLANDPYAAASAAAGTGPSRSAAAATTTAAAANGGGGDPGTLLLACVGGAAGKAPSWSQVQRALMQPRTVAIWRRTTPLPATAAASVVGGCIPEPVLAAGSISSAAAGAAAVAAAAGDEEVQLPLPQPSNVVAEAIGAYFEHLLSTPQAPLPPLPSLPQEPLMDWQQAEQPPPPPPPQQQQMDQQQMDQQQHAEEHTQAAGELLQGAGVAGRQAAEQVLEWQLADAVLQRQDQPLTLHVPPSPPAPLPLPHTQQQQHNGQQHKQQQQLELQQPSEVLEPPPPLPLQQQQHDPQQQSAEPLQLQAPAQLQQQQQPGLQGLLAPALPLPQQPQQKQHQNDLALGQETQLLDQPPLPPLPHSPLPQQTEEALKPPPPPSPSSLPPGSQCWAVGGSGAWAVAVLGGGASTVAAEEAVAPAAAEGAAATAWEVIDEVAADAVVGPIRTDIKVQRGAAAAAGAAVAAIAAVHSGAAAAAEASCGSGSGAIREGDVHVAADAGGQLLPGVMYDDHVADIPTVNDDAVPADAAALDAATAVDPAAVSTVYGRPDVLGAGGGAQGTMPHGLGELASELPVVSCSTGSVVLGADGVLTPTAVVSEQGGSGGSGGGATPLATALAVPPYLHSLQLPASSVVHGRPIVHEAATPRRSHGGGSAVEETATSLLSTRQPTAVAAAVVAAAVETAVAAEIGNLSAEYAANVPGLSRSCRSTEEPSPLVSHVTSHNDGRAVAAALVPDCEDANRGGGGGGGGGGFGIHAALATGTEARMTLQGVGGPGVGVGGVMPAGCSRSSVPPAAPAAMAAAVAGAAAAPLPGGLLSCLGPASQQLPPHLAAALFARARSGDGGGGDGGGGGGDVGGGGDFRVGINSMLAAQLPAPAREALIAAAAAAAAAIGPGGGDSGLLGAEAAGPAVALPVRQDAGPWPKEHGTVLAGAQRQPPQRAEQLLDRDGEDEEEDGKARGAAGGGGGGGGAVRDRRGREGYERRSPQRTLRPPLDVVRQPYDSHDTHVPWRGAGNTGGGGGGADWGPWHWDRGVDGWKGGAGFRGRGRGRGSDGGGGGGKRFDGRGAPWVDRGEFGGYHAKARVEGRGRRFDDYHAHDAHDDGGGGHRRPNDFPSHHVDSHQQRPGARGYDVPYHSGGNGSERPCRGGQPLLRSEEHREDERDGGGSNGRTGPPDGLEATERPWQLPAGLPKRVGWPAEDWEQAEVLTRRRHDQLRHGTRRPIIGQTPPQPPPQPAPLQAADAVAWEKEKPKPGSQDHETDAGARYDAVMRQTHEPAGGWGVRDVRIRNSHSDWRQPAAAAAAAAAPAGDRGRAAAARCHHQPGWPPQPPHPRPSTRTPGPDEVAGGLTDGERPRKRARGPPTAGVVEAGGSGGGGGGATDTSSVSDNSCYSRIACSADGVNVNPSSYLAPQVKVPNYHVNDIWKAHTHLPNYPEIEAAARDTFVALPSSYDTKYRNPCCRLAQYTPLPIGYRTQDGTSTPPPTAPPPTAPPPTAPPPTAPPPTAPPPSPPPTSPSPPPLPGTTTPLHPGAVGVAEPHRGARVGRVRIRGSGGPHLGGDHQSDAGTPGDKTAASGGGGGGSSASSSSSSRIGN
ncbi:hypothetical protein VOLCADRAFT_108582 [Volvox carteri f. nagariensis]|uniref:Uncharacterized protein n=1 Tax=Volvox carteri f. nagariensis TaxID=3068 RepID=D8UL36_VOLCA|nr:uncharacterized protein VOLCADRAFT_108582 [Volvox carteri f. nagariensis]EFJ39562.1 hypothetical protein VOLCADRAFT_108582 [Volvox carteri f. nagariensis]|eukprot:XP_002959372.1 hypothetical protein VOLCADRAFT_108582 [Volvox carteri f. nagariensis]